MEGLVAHSADGSRAWIEDRDDVAHVLIAAPDGALRVERALALQSTDNWGYEGCRATHLDWYGDRLVCVSQEERVTAVHALALDGGDERRIVIESRHVIAGDVVFWPSRREPGLIDTAHLPSLAPLAPLPCASLRPPIWTGLVRRGDRLVVEEDRETRDRGRLRRTPVDELPIVTSEALAFSARHALSADVERALFAEGSPDGALLVESCALALSTAIPSGGTAAWWPACWHRHLRSTGASAEAAGLLALLDRCAAETTRRAAPRSDVERAVLHVRRRAALLAETCRSGKPPRGWWPLDFDPRFDRALLTPRLRAVFDVLCASPQPRFETG